jgi:hypothetical protein
VHRTFGLRPHQLGDLGGKRRPAREDRPVVEENRLLERLPRHLHEQDRIAARIDLHREEVRRRQRVRSHSLACRVAVITRAHVVYANGGQMKLKRTLVVYSRGNGLVASQLELTAFVQDMAASTSLPHRASASASSAARAFAS